VSGELRTLRALAPAKINLGLFLGPVRDSDGRHELATVMQSISLADELTLGPAPGGGVGDELVCPDVPGPAGHNLAARALREFRARTGWQAPPLRLTVEKRIPLAAGLAGGSADAGATLRLARAASGLGDEELLLDIARGLGADVPAQVTPGRWLASGAGERLERLPPPATSFGVLLLPAGFELSTAEVYAEADRLGLGHDRSELHRCHEELASALANGAPLPAATELLHNDLQRAAVSLRGEIAEALRTLGAAGASPALVAGSGPTAVGIFARPRDEGVALARIAAETLAGRDPGPLAAAPVEAAFGEALPIDRDPAPAA
jgi:4-diphosphocytidyl-2-C-methyl-D-erythritol kinase